MLRTEENLRPPDIDIARSALFLDIDGTLLDIAATPRAVVVPPKLIATIAGLAAKFAGALAFVSGRTLADIDGLFSPLKLSAIGCHGAQFRPDPEGAVDNAPAITEKVRAWVKALVSSAPGLTVEDKCFALAIHYRLAPEEAPVLARALAERRAQLAAEGLQILHGKAVIEIRSLHYTKGTALRRLMDHAPFKGRMPVFFGDDTTDEDVFRVLPSFGGKGFAVGRAIQGAAFTFKSPQAVRRWLSALEESSP